VWPHLGQEPHSPCGRCSLSVGLSDTLPGASVTNNHILPSYAIPWGISFEHCVQQPLANSTGYISEKHKNLQNKNLKFYIYLLIFVWFQVLTAASMMFRVVFWDILPC
jgi:uncharacterized protein (DUF486 family)